MATDLIGIFYCHNVFLKAQSLLNSYGAIKVSLTKSGGVSPVRILFIALGLGVVAAFVFFFVFYQDAETVDPLTGRIAPGSAEQTGDTDQLTESLVPRFDIVRVDPQGSAVVAGRGQPGSEIRLYANGSLIASETAVNERGEWVIVVDTPLGEGDQELTLEMVLADGSTVTSTETVVVAVPDRPGMKPLVILGNDQGMSKILQQPGDGVMVGDLSIDIIDYGDDGRVILQGRAKPGANVRGYIDNQPIGDALSDDEGRWTLVPTQSIAPGRYTLRLDQLGEKGLVTARVEVPFERAEPDQARLAAGQVVVQPGNSLWRISRRLYGRGTLYTVIFESNQDHIKDPDLIYPGQIFVLPSLTDALQQ